MLLYPALLDQKRSGWAKRYVDSHFQGSRPDLYQGANQHYHAGAEDLVLIFQQLTDEAYRSVFSRNSTAATVSIG